LTSRSDLLNVGAALHQGPGGVDRIDLGFVDILPCEERLDLPLIGARGASL
jgi:hypothetical protein